MTPPSGVLWITEQVKTKLAAATWSIFLFFGGLIFLLYFAHIRFMPELEVGSSVALLAAAAITGAVYILALSIALTVPSVVWSAVILNLRSLKPLFYKNNKVSRLRLGLWLGIPLLLELLAIVTSTYIVAVNSKYDTQTQTANFYLRHGETIVVVSAVSVVVLAWVLMTLVLFRSRRRVFQRLPRAKLRVLLRESAHSLLYWVIFAASCCCFILPIVLVGLVIEPNAHGDEDLWLVLGLILFTVAVNILITIVSNWPNGLRWRVLISISASFLLLLFLEATVKISSSVMRMYGFGNIPNSFVVLKPEGCALLSQAGINTCPKSDAMCILNNVYILSRVGATYFLRTTNAAGEPVNLTVPRESVLSWGRRPVDEVFDFMVGGTSNPVIYSVLIESLNICDAGNIVIVKDQPLIPGEEVSGEALRLTEVVDRYHLPFGRFTFAERLAFQNFLRSVPSLLLSSFERSELPENLLGAEFKYPSIRKDDFGAIRQDKVRWAEFWKAHPNASVLSLSPIVESDNSAALIYEMVNQAGERKLFLALFYRADEVWTLFAKLEIPS